MSLYNKYFVIGFNKTATTTFHSLFQKNGLRSQHSTKWDINKYDCFSDNGNLNNYKLLNEKYKKSIFILNTRFLDKWLISRFKHGIRKKQKWADLSISNCEQWINDRESYYLEILEYFKNESNKLILINIDRDGWINYICKELNFKVNNIPSKNVHNTNFKNPKHIEIIKLVNSTLNRLNYKKKTILLNNDNLCSIYMKLYKNYL